FRELHQRVHSRKIEPPPLRLVYSHHPHGERGVEFPRQNLLPFRVFRPRLGPDSGADPEIQFVRILPQRFLVRSFLFGCNPRNAQQHADRENQSISADHVYAPAAADSSAEASSSSNPCFLILRRRNSAQPSAAKK